MVVVFTGEVNNPTHFCGEKFHILRRLVNMILDGLGVSGGHKLQNNARYSGFVDHYVAISVFSMVIFKMKLSSNRATFELKPGRQDPHELCIIYTLPRDRSIALSIDI